MNNQEHTWPEYLFADNSTACIRLVTVMTGKKQYLLFSLVEMYPNEIPAPPNNIEPRVKSLGKRGTLVLTVKAMTVREALDWYESAIASKLTVPGLSRRVPVIVGNLGAEPALGSLVTSNGLPFDARWYCGARINQLILLDEAPADLDWLSLNSDNDFQNEVRGWLIDELGFDLLAYDEYMYGIVLLVPNPVFRAISTRIKGSTVAGGEVIEIYARARCGVSLSDIKIFFKEDRPAGDFFNQECALDSNGFAEIHLPQTCWRSSVQITSELRGLIYADTPSHFLRRFSISTSVPTHKAIVRIPARSKGATDGMYAIQHLDHETREVQVSKLLPASERLSQLKSRRTTRSKEQRPNGLAEAFGDSEQLHFQNRTRAVNAIREIIAKARQTLVFVDPFFNEIDLREFALCSTHADVAVSILTGREFAKGESPSRTALNGDLFVEDMLTLESKLKPLGMKMPLVKVMGDRARTYHDRFLIVDEAVWHIGHSFNRLGESDVAMISRLQYPDEIRSWILEDLGLALMFADWWEIQRTRATRNVYKSTQQLFYKLVSVDLPSWLDCPDIKNAHRRRESILRSQVFDFMGNGTLPLPCRIQDVK